ncbi:putative bifunctional diguanylate cyclase/phosphodiesterase, partial [Magnetococcales bacterium HHB-1]
FMIVIRQLINPEQGDAIQAINRVARRLHECFTEPFSVDGHELFQTISIGIAIHPNDGIDAETLIHNAKSAANRAKKQGASRTSIQFYIPALGEQSSRRLALESRLSTAIKKAQFTLHYQPKISLHTGKITGIESLVRWKSADVQVLPNEFIPQAEESDLMSLLGDWILKESCSKQKSWLDKIEEPLRISVNLSASQFYHKKILDKVRQVLIETGLAPEHLELEVTENVLSENQAQARITLKALREMGVYIALDDFGTGYSSLTQLKAFPLRALKIDRRFIHELPSNPHDIAIVSTIISMAHNLGLKAVAEGVETQDQIDFLRNLKCDEIQGFFISRPLPAKKMKKLLLQDNSLLPSKSA